MKIAIFHNLQKGGALNFVTETVRQLNKKHNVDLYCFEKNISTSLFNKTHLSKLNKTNNVFTSMCQIFFELKTKNQEIADKINKKKYDLTIVFPSTLTQSPYVLRYLNPKNVSIYIFTETKREFYEKTNYKKTLKNLICKIIRFPIKHIDRTNCKHAKNILSISQYSAHLLSKIYKRKSQVVYPGMKFIAPTKILTSNNKKLLSVGVLQKIKGHDFSIKQISKIKCQFTILGRKNKKDETIKKLIKNKTNIKLIHDENNQKKEKRYKEHSFFLANQNKEPFGLSTLEATNYNCYVFGKNEGGTSEIIKHGINGFLYPNRIKTSAKALQQKIHQKNVVIIKNCKIDWKESTEHLLYLYHYLKNEPTE
ncbi:glycosyltransferase [Patescibacteria group bacterium]|nr:glycosyltransferase [Patescibacteria group bacterium]